MLTPLDSVLLFVTDKLNLSGHETVKSIIHHIKIKLLTFLVLVLCLFCMTSCKKVTEFNNQDYGKVDYYVAGSYIQVNKYDELEMSDPNPKIYYDFSNSTRFGVLSTKSGSKDAAMSITNIGKDEKLEDNIKKYYMTANVRFVNSDVEEITLYLINIGKDGKVYINEELSEIVNFAENSSYHFMTQFKNNKQKYQIEMKLKFI
jgi:hypothetical protein